MYLFISRFFLFLCQCQSQSGTETQRALMIDSIGGLWMWSLKNPCISQTWNQIQNGNDYQNPFPTGMSLLLKVFSHKLKDVTNKNFDPLMVLDEMSGDEKSGSTSL